MFKPKNPLKRPERDENNLTPGQQAFVKAYMDKDQPTYLCATKSYKKAFPKAKDSTANVNGPRLLQFEKINKSMQELVNKRSIKARVLRGLTHLASNPEHRKFISAAELLAKIGGWMAPEKHVNVNLDPATREQTYEEILNKIRGVQNTQHTQSVMEGVRRDQPTEHVVETTAEITITPS